MQITAAKTAGFCFGVDRSVKTLFSLLEAGKKVYTLGPLIHNPQFIKELEEKGVYSVGSVSEILSAVNGTPSLTSNDVVLVIRTHGIPKETLNEIRESGVGYHDATCPFVSKIHKIVSDGSGLGSIVLIAGDKGHPEVKGIKSYSKGRTFVFADADELSEITKNNPDIKEKSGIFVAQTTFSTKEFEKCLKIINLLYTNVKIFDTICNATFERQREAVKMSLENDIMIVVGGKNSSNTEKLCKLCSENTPTHLIEDPEELHSLDFSNCRSVGITAGASTPYGKIKEVRIIMSEIENEMENMVEKEKEIADVAEKETVDEFENAPEAANEIDFAVDNIAEIGTAENNEIEPAAETNKVMSEDAAFFAALEENLKKMNTDREVVGTVLRVTPTEVQVDIGRKQTGYIPLEEYSADSDADPTKELEIGDKINLIIMKTNDLEGTIMLSKRLFDAVKYWNEIKNAEKDGSVLTGKVVEVFEKGVLASTNGIRVFIPASLTGTPKGSPLEEMLYTEVQYQVIEVDRKRRRAVGSISSVIRANRKMADAAFWDQVAIGQTYTGTVKSITSFAAFVDLGGVDGMVHRSELAWRRIKHPSDVVNIGDFVDVYIKSFDREKKKVSLGYRKPEDNPWEVLRSNYAKGSIAEVKVSGLTAFGAFAQIIPGIDGLIHISQISDRRIAKPQDVLAVGDEVKAIITDIDFDKKRVSLSIRALLEPEALDGDAEDVKKDRKSAAGEPAVPMSIDELLAIDEKNKAKEIIDEPKAEPAAEEAVAGEPAEIKQED